MDCFRKKLGLTKLLSYANTIRVVLLQGDLFFSFLESHSFDVLGSEISISPLTLENVQN